MQTVSNANFGPLIAYLVPGATAFWGISQFVPSMHAWFATTQADAPTISGFLYLTIASLAIGMIVTALRWAIVDSIHRFTGLRPPDLDFSALAEKVEAFNLLIEIHYRHYQYYGDMFVGTGIAYLCYRSVQGFSTAPGLLELVIFGLEVIFLATSRDTLRKYYERSRQLLNGKD